MRKRIIILTLVFGLILCISVYSSVYHSLFSTSIINTDAIGTSESVVVRPIGGDVTFSKLSGLSKQEDMFAGCIYDGEKIWLVPYSYDKIVYYSKNGEQNHIKIDTAVQKMYYGGAYDGKNIYLAPYNANEILQIDKETKQTIKISFDKGVGKYKGASFDGEKVWFFPSDGNKIISLDNLGEIKYCTIPYSIPQNAFCGGVIVNEVIYLIPDKYENIVSYNISKDEFSEISMSSCCSFCGAVTDGNTIWMISKNGKIILSLDTNDLSIKEIKIDKDADNMEFCGGVYDGRFIWMAPISGNNICKYDTENKQFSLYSLEDDESYLGGVFDGKNVWFAPFNASSPLVINGNNTPPVVQNIFLSVPAGENITSELSANDTDEGDNVKFSITEEALHGIVDLDRESGVFTYKAGNTAGVDEFYFKATDMYDDSNIGKVVITISENSREESSYFDMENHWAKEAAEYFKAEGIIDGEKVDSYKYFYPDIPINRVHFIIWINSALGYVGDVSDNTLPFEDIKNERPWVINAASAAYHNKVILGEERGEKLYFNPYKDLNRLEAFVMMHNILKPTQSENERIDFDDKDIFPTWSLEIIKSLQSAGVLNGYDDNTLRIYNKVTRAEAAQMIYETVNSMGKMTKNTERLK